jgi:tetratricopeptide (TPR) repeat protein
MSRVWKLRAGKLAILWFVINLLPVMNLSAFDVFFIMQERYLYLPSIGLSLLVAMALTELPIERALPIANRRTIRIAALVLVCILLGGKTLAQNAVWKDDLTLFEHGAATAEDQMMPHYILGFLYLKMQRFDKASDELEKCLAISPGNRVAMVNLASSHLNAYDLTNNRSHLDRAIAVCQQGLLSANQEGAGPDIEMALNQKAVFYDDLGHAYLYETERRNYDLAIFYIGQALRIEPNNPAFLSHIGGAYFKAANFPLAIQFLEKSRQLDPDLADNYKSLSYAYDRTGRTKEAIDSLNRYLALSPNAIDAAQQRRRLGQLQAKLEPGNAQG